MLNSLIVRRVIYGMQCVLANYATLRPMPSRRYFAVVFWLLRRQFVQLWSKKLLEYRHSYGIQATLVTPLGALSVIFTALLSRYFLKDRLNFFGFLSFSFTIPQCSRCAYFSVLFRTPTGTVCCRSATFVLPVPCDLTIRKTQHLICPF